MPDVGLSLTLALTMVVVEALLLVLLPLVMLMLLPCMVKQCDCVRFPGDRLSLFARSDRLGLRAARANVRAIPCPAAPSAHHERTPPEAVVAALLAQARDAHIAAGDARRACHQDEDCRSRAAVIKRDPLNYGLSS